MLANHCYDEINDGNKEVANHRVIRVAMVVPAMPLPGLYAIVPEREPTTLTRVTLLDTCNIARQFSDVPATRQFLPSPAKIATCKFEHTL